MRPFSDAVATEPCAKCGCAPKENDSYARETSPGLRKPVFAPIPSQPIDENLDARGYLEWPCPNCGHRIVTATKDAA